MKWSSLSPQHKKLAVEVGVLLIVFVAFLVFSITASVSRGQEAEETLPPRLNTEFNTEILDSVRDTDTTQPTYDGNTGKPNPFVY